MIKNQKSHISISSNEYSDNSLDKNKNKKQSLNNINLEQYLNKLILISLKHKKFLERNDYFYSQLKRQTNIKKVKLKLTPFQKYEKFKMISKKIKLNKTKNKYPLNTKKYPNKINTLLTTKNYKIKNKIYENNSNNPVNHYSNSNYIINNKPIFNKTKLYINSIDTNNNFYPNLKIKKNKYSHLSYDSTINAMNKNKNKIILILTSQNEKLSIELENIINRDSQLLHTLGRDTYLRAVQYENKNVIDSSLNHLNGFTQIKKKENDYDKNANDIKLKDINYRVNFNELGNNPVPAESTRNKTGLKLNMQYTSSFGEDLDQRK